MNLFESLTNLNDFNFTDLHRYLRLKLMLKRNPIGLRIDYWRDHINDELIRNWRNPFGRQLLMSLDSSIRIPWKYRLSGNIGEIFFITRIVMLMRILEILFL